MQLSDQIRDAILPVIQELFGDTGFNCELTLRQMGDVAWDDDLKKNVTAHTDSDLTAIRMKHTKRSIEKVVGAERAERMQIRVGDSLFLLFYSDVTGDVNPGDFLIYDGQSLKVKDSEPKFKLVWVVTVAGA